jgi:serine/threonine protein kinase
LRAIVGNNQPGLPTRWQMNGDRRSGWIEATLSEKMWTSGSRMGSKGKDRDYAQGERIPGTEYIVNRLVARGGHGALYLVRHHYLEKKMLMLKTLRAVEPNRELVERLKREAQVLAGMEHPHIVSVVSGGLTDEPSPRPYFVMERLKGRSLANVLPAAKRGVGIEATLKIGRELAEALDYVHTEHGIVHRDLKPDNIFIQLTLNGSNTKLLDFGVMHMLQLDKRHTKERLFLGTFRYAAPEQLFGDPPVPQTDLYALGLVLYELLTGRHPFEDCENIQELGKAQIARTPPPFPADLNCPLALEVLVFSMLEKKIADRPKSAEVVRYELDQITQRHMFGDEPFVAAEMNQTDPTPLQNILTMTRGEATDPGAARSPTAPVSPTPARQGAVHDTVEMVGPVVPHDAVAAPTTQDPPIGFLPTQLSPKPPIVAAPTASVISSSPSAAPARTPPNVPSSKPTTAPWRDAPPVVIGDKTLESAAPIDRYATTPPVEVMAEPPRHKTDTDVLTVLVEEAKKQEKAEPPKVGAETSGSATPVGASLTPVPRRSAPRPARGQGVVGSAAAGAVVAIILLVVWARFFRHPDAAPVPQTATSSSVAATPDPDPVVPPPVAPPTVAAPSSAAPSASAAASSAEARPVVRASARPAPKTDVMRDDLLPTMDSNLAPPPPRAPAPSASGPSPQRRTPGSGL